LSPVALAAGLFLLSPAGASALDVHVGGVSASVGGGSGHGIGASVGVGDASVGAGIGGGDGARASVGVGGTGVDAGIGGGTGVTANVESGSIGAGGTPGSGANGGMADLRTLNALGANPARLDAELGAMDAAEIMRLKHTCRQVLGNPGLYLKDAVQVCHILAAL
jgi:hypothetical protein